MPRTHGQVIACLPPEGHDLGGLLCSGGYITGVISAIWSRQTDRDLELRTCELHGAWDWLHDTKTVSTHVAAWFPPACAAFDFVIAGFVLSVMT